MGFMLSKCCCRANSVDVLPEKQLKVLLLGLASSGKSELGHKLSAKERLDFDATNGVQYYQMKFALGQLSITEIGGNTEMQKIWHHYFVTVMGLIYCFDVSAAYEDMKKSLEVLCQILTHPFMRGKPVLLVATKIDLMSESVQLYDIENTFQLEALAKYYTTAVHLCYYEHDNSVETGNAPPMNNNLFDGINWLTKFMLDNYDILSLRLKCDINMKNWQNQTNKLIADGILRRSRYQRFPTKSKVTKYGKLWRLTYRRRRSGRVRTSTAPSKVYTISTETINTIVTASADSIDNSTIVPPVMEQTVIAQVEQVSDV